MKSWMYAAVLLAAPALAQVPLPTKDEPAKKEATKTRHHENEAFVPSCFRGVLVARAGLLTRE